MSPLTPTPAAGTNVTPNRKDTAMTPTPTLLRLPYTDRSLRTALHPVHLRHQALLYPGSVHLLSGGTATGKSTIAAYAAAEVVNEGGRVVVVTNEPTDLVRERIARFLHHPEPTGYVALTHEMSPPAEQVAGADLVVFDHDLWPGEGWLESPCRLTTQGHAVLVTCEASVIEMVGRPSVRAAIDVHYSIRRPHPESTTLLVNLVKDRWGHIETRGDGVAASAHADDMQAAAHDAERARNKAMGLDLPVTDAEKRGQAEAERLRRARAEAEPEAEAEAS